MENERPSQQTIQASAIVHGSLWAFGGQIALALTTLLTIPFLVRFLGPEGYGVYSLISVVISYLVFADLGMGVASTRFGSRALSRQDGDEEARVTWTSLMINAIPTLLIVAALSVAAIDILDLFVTASDPLLHTGALGLRIAAAAYLFRSFSQVFNTPLLTRMRMDLNARITGITVILQAVATVWVLMAGGRLVAVFVTTLAAAAANALATYFAAIRLLPESAAPKVDSALVRPILIFGMPLMISYFASVALGNAEKLFLAYFDSVVSLAHYSVAFTVASAFALISAALSQSLVPVFARLQARNKIEEARALCETLIRLILFAALPAAALLMTASRPFFTLWAGPEYGRESSLPFLILVVGAVLNLIANVPYIVLMSYGRSGLIARYHLLQLAPYLCLAGLLTFWMGAMGAALAWSLRNLIDLVQMSIGASQTTVIDPMATIKRIRRIAWPSLVLPLPVVFAFGATEFLATSLVTFAALGAYVISSWFIVLDDEERSVMKRLFGGRVGG